MQQVGCSRFSMLEIATVLAKPRILLVVASLIVLLPCHLHGKLPEILINAQVGPARAGHQKLLQACDPAIIRIKPSTEQCVLRHWTDSSYLWSGGLSPSSSHGCTDNLRVWAAGHTITLQQMLCALRMMPSPAARIQLCVIFWARLLDRANTWPKVGCCCPRSASC